MDIIKEVTVNADVDYVWSYLQKNALKSKEPGKNGPDSDNKLLLDSPDLRRKWKISSIKEPNFIMLEGKKQLAGISIKLEFSPKNKRTLMKLKIKGWERIDREVSRKVIPEITLDWEKSLKRRKKIIELSTKRD